MTQLVPLRSCTSCGTITVQRCPHGHPLCQTCQDHYEPCEACLEDAADTVRGLRP